MTSEFGTDQKQVSVQVEEDYQKHLLSTIDEMYPKYKQKRVLRELEKQRIVRLRKTKVQSVDETAIDLSDIEEGEQLSKGIESGDIAVFRQFEKDEFLKSYKYAAIFNVSTTNHSIFKQLQESGLIQDFFSQDYSYDHLYEGVDYKDIKPTIYTIGNVILIKFSRLLSGFTPGTGEKKQIKYPILGVYFKHLGILEVRFDNAKAYYHDNEYFYHKQVAFVLSWFKLYAGFEIKDINLTSIINYINKQEQDEVNVYSQAMSLPSGGKAVLEAGENENYTLPLIGELKELIKTNEELFEGSPKIKELLETFISETEAKSDLPWISLIWKGQGKEKDKGIHVKFKHNYMNQGYTLLHYHGLQSDMEKMNYVTEYINEYRRKLEGTFGDGEVREAAVTI